MNPVSCVSVVAALLAMPLPVTRVSDPTGVFAILDKVVLKPDAEKPTTLELHGAFAIAAGGRGNEYRAPRRGVLRFGLGRDPEEAVKQWRELQKHAGTGKIVSFSSRYEQAEKGTPPVVTDGAAAPGPMSPYGTGWGLHVVENVGYGPVRELLLLPSCEPEALLGEAERPGWMARRLTLACRNCPAPDANLAYVFEVQTSGGDRFASSAIPAGKERTTWSVDLYLEPGETVSWSVHVVGEKVARAPCATASFTVPAPADAGR
jgi:hypothetical protein